MRERKRRPGDFHSTCSAAWWCWKRPGVWRWEESISVCVGGDLALSEKAASCSLLSSSSPMLVAQKLPWDWRMERAVEGGWAGHSPSTPRQGRESPGSHMLGKQLCGGTNSRSIPEWRGDCWQHRPGKGKECGKREEEECPHRQGLMSYWDGFWARTGHMWKQSPAVLLLLDSGLSVNSASSNHRWTSSY